jgi:hypothetical protein
MKEVSAVKREISQPLVIAAVVIVVIAAGVFGWFQLNNTTPNVSAQETKKGVDRQMQGMMEAARQMKR